MAGISGISAPSPLPESPTHPGPCPTRTYRLRCAQNRAPSTDPRTPFTCEHSTHTPLRTYTHGGAQTHTRTRSAQLRAAARDSLLPALAPSPPLRVSLSQWIRAQLLVAQLPTRAAAHT